MNLSSGDPISVHVTACLNVKFNAFKSSDNLQDIKKAFSSSSTKVKYLSVFQCAKRPIFHITIFTCDSVHIIGFKNLLGINFKGARISIRLVTA